jgi:hypothetical protein
MASSGMTSIPFLSSTLSFKQGYDKVGSEAGVIEIWPLATQDDEKSSQVPKLA